MLLTDKEQTIEIEPTQEEWLVIVKPVIFTMDSPDLERYLIKLRNQGFFVVGE